MKLIKCILKSVSSISSMGLLFKLDIKEGGKPIAVVILYDITYMI